MADYTLISDYEFEYGGAQVIMGFTIDKQLYTKMVFVKKAVPLQEVSSVVIKKAFASTNLQCTIKSTSNGKEKTFQTIQFDITDEKGKRFLDELKAAVSVGCKWNDTMENFGEDVKDTSAERIYPVQFWFWFSKTLAGMSRGVQIGVNYGTFCLLILPIPLLIYVLAAGCYRVTTNANGIKIKKFFGSYFTWEEVDHFNITKYNITITDYGAKTGEAFLLIFELVAKNGKKKKFMIRTLEGKQFVNEMVERGKLSKEMSEMFI